MFSDPENRFSNLPITTDYIDGRKWRLNKNVAYNIAEVPGFIGAVSTVRDGFIFDWASIPRPFWRLLPPAGDHRQPYGMAALWHDWVYVHQQIDSKPCTRKNADLLFREIMIYVGVSRFRATLMYLAVRAGGWLGWRRNRREAQNGPVKADSLKVSTITRVCRVRKYAACF